jgi:hypothetical protein
MVALHLSALPLLQEALTSEWCCCCRWCWCNVEHDLGLAGVVDDERFAAAAAASATSVVLLL